MPNNTSRIIYSIRTVRIAYKLLISMRLTKSVSPRPALLARAPHVAAPSAAPFPGTPAWYYSIKIRSINSISNLILIHVQVKVVVRSNVAWRGKCVYKAIPNTAMQLLAELGAAGRAGILALTYELDEYRSLIFTCIYTRNMTLSHRSRRRSSRKCFAKNVMPG